MDGYLRRQAPLSHLAGAEPGQSLQPKFRRDLGMSLLYAGQRSVGQGVESADEVGYSRIQAQPFYRAVEILPYDR